jgi:acyl carrier protein
MRVFVVGPCANRFFSEECFARMTLSPTILDFLSEKARRAGARQPALADDLFKLGVIDSFSLVDLIALLEETYGIRIPDADVNATNFRSIEAIAEYLETEQG